MFEGRDGAVVGVVLEAFVAAAPVAAVEDTAGIDPGGEADEIGAGEPQPGVVGILQNLEQPAPAGADGPGGDVLGAVEVRGFGIGRDDAGAQQVLP